MRLRRTLGLLALGLLLTGVAHLFAANRWAKYEREMQDPIDDPPDANVPAEFAFGRLRYRSPQDGFRRARWGTDANKGERLFIIAMRRLSLINAQSIEQIVDVGSDDLFDWPFMYAVAAGDWTLSDSEAQRLGKYFERGGFLVVDDLHNDREWGDFMYGIEQAMPGAVDDEIPDDDPIFHQTYDISDRVMISGYQVVRGQPYERGGYQARWRAVRDSKGRIYAAGWHNQDLGDAWEWADAPEYPEDLSNRAFRFGVNYVTYAMTH
ncbi:MAG: DUF4159 domain-containing protein [Bryobacteraceae bacterium]